MYSPNGVATVTGAWAAIVSLQEVCPNVVGTVMGAWSFPDLVGDRVPLLVMLLRPSASWCSQGFSLFFSSSVKVSTTHERTGGSGNTEEEGWRAGQTDRQRDRQQTKKV